MAACTGCHVELNIPNRPEFVAVARLAVSAIATRMNFDIEAIEDIKVALGEACNNAIEHGCPSSAGNEMIEIRCDLEANGLVITVQDSGDGFDPTTATRQHRHGTMTLSERGLGMLLIESLMDEVDFSSTPGDGTQVRMMKRLRAVEGR
ncbi:MAG TPA: ATP-binding protein [Armatimonadota bacterium]|jgi:serine/threonine-protein kinase RsbW|nr:ATP-binding protein [Armatimonadota bacterium]